MIRSLVVSGLIVASAANGCLCQDLFIHERGQSERDDLWNKWHLCIYEMHYYLDAAEEESRQIRNVNVQKATTAAIKGGIAGLAGKNVYAVAVGAILGAVGEVAGDSYEHYRASKALLRDAKVYAMIADDIQEQLWNLEKANENYTGIRHR